MNRKSVLRKWILPIICTLIFGAVWYYIEIPALNYKSVDFWMFLVVIVIAFLALRWLFSKNIAKAKTVSEDQQKKTVSVNIGGKDIPLNFNKPSDKMARKLKIGGIVVGVIVVGLIAVWVTSSEIFNAQAYHNQLQVEEGNFQQDISEIPRSQIPVVDKETAKKLGNRKLGEVVSLVSQFEISDLYTQINYNNTPTRVSPLMYSDIIKWFTNQSVGIPYYIRINMATQETELVELQDPIRYSPYEHFNRHLMRHLRFQYPTAMFDNPLFETDDNGRPYWVVPVYDYEIGVVGGKDITSILLVDASTGEVTEYAVEDVPQWIDNVYPASLLNKQADNWGKYGNGWLNSIFGQRDVITTTEGYNSLAIDDDLWMYTGLTSVTGDQSNIGFILANMRTKETKYYKINGADEESAMRSAEGKVQEKKYQASFPILINVADKPTYFMSLKDAAGLIKQYAFVSVEQYQIVGVGDTVSDAQTSYVQQLKANGAADTVSSTEVSGTVASLATAVVDGNTNFYFTLTEDPSVTYIASISVNSHLPLLQSGQAVKLDYTVNMDESLRYVNRIELF